MVHYFLILTAKTEYEFKKFMFNCVNNLLIVNKLDIKYHNLESDTFVHAFQKRDEHSSQTKQSTPTNGHDKA